MKPIDIVIALLVALIWAASFSVIEIGLTQFPPLLFATLRFTIVALFALLFVPWPTGHARDVIAFGMLMGLLQFGCLFFAMDGHADAGTSALLLQAQVPLTMVLAVMLLGERVSHAQWTGVGICALGLALVFVGQSGRVDSIGLMLTLIAALSFAGGNLVMRASSGIKGFHLVAWSSLVPPLPLFALSLMLEGTDPLATMLAVDAEPWLALVYVAVFATLISFGLWGRLLSTYSTASVLPIAMCIPVFAQIVATVWLGEPLGARDVVVTAVVLAGALLCQQQPDMRESIDLNTTSSAAGSRHANKIATAQCRSRL